MFKKIFLILLILLAPSFVVAIVVDSVLINNISDSYIYSRQFDVLVLDAVIPLGNNLTSLAIKNEGNAQDRYDIAKFVLWSDAGEEGFQGMGKDNEVGDFEHKGGNDWEINNINLEIPEEGLRIFISAETASSPTTNRFIQIKIPEWNILNSGKQLFRGFVGSENLPPKSIIDKPSLSETIAVDNYIIMGRSKDQGGSTPAWVKIKINDNWYDAEDTGANYSTWQYKWEGITEGNYTLETKSADWLGNTETEGDVVNVTVDFPVSDVGVGLPDPGDDGGETPPLQDAPLSSIEILQAQIAEIQQQIIDLLGQLIEIYLQQLNL